jgi:hypothetical protein
MRLTSSEYSQYVDQSATPHPMPNATNVNLPGNTDQADPQLTPQQCAAIYIGDAAAPTLNGTPGGDGNTVLTHVLENIMGCGQVFTTILNLDGINTMIHDLLSIHTTTIRHQWIIIRPIRSNNGTRPTCRHNGRHYAETTSTYCLQHH